MKRVWYEMWDYREHRRYWWSSRDENGVCFEIHKRGDKLRLYKVGRNDALESIADHDSLGGAMEAAETFAAKLAEKLAV